MGFIEAFPKEDIIAAPGTVTAYCYVVKKGRVIAFEYAPGGEERVYNFMEEQSLFLEAHLLTGIPVAVYFKAAKPSELYCIDRTSLLAAMADDPQLTCDIIETLSNKFFAAMDQLRQGCCYSAAWRICNLLLIFADRFGTPYDGKVLVKEKISQQMISNLLGINRATAVRIMKSLKDSALIEQINGYYCIRDVEKLKRHLEHIG
ncbi:MAG: Crp/Fnr family transcriptional regulator [Synergistaceae bacterium]|nr:Crp/Fnr family transcriptional regulator [Synergistaceae bacterium]